MPPRLCIPMLDQPGAGSIAEVKREKPARRHKWIGRILVIALLAAVAVGLWGIWRRNETEAKLTKWTQAQAVPSVELISPQPVTEGPKLTLPGDIEAYYEAAIYARVPGYLKMWYQDIGAQVKAGQLLAEIETPELDQQLAQAKSDLASVKAAAALADLTASRWTALLRSKAVSQQAADEKTGEALRTKAQVQASAANVERLQALESFKRITAPFDGVVTARQTDIGALINAGSGTGTELFKVADIHAMRVYVRVPQTYAPELHPGIKATLSLPQSPGKAYPAAITTTSNAVSKDSRSVLVELMAANPTGELWPGTFAETNFDLPPDKGIYTLPTSALLFREHGMEIAVLGPQDKVQLKPIHIGRDLGTKVEVIAGLAPSDRVIDSPSDSLTAGDKVKPLQPKQAPKGQDGQVAGAQAGK